jgi:hypothetical protein
MLSDVVVPTRSVRPVIMLQYLIASATRRAHLTGAARANAALSPVAAAAAVTEVTSAAIINFAARLVIPAAARPAAPVGQRVVTVGVVSRAIPAATAVAALREQPAVKRPMVHVLAATPPTVRSVWMANVKTSAKQKSASTATILFSQVFVNLIATRNYARNVTH